MRYINAAEVLPKQLLIQIQQHIHGELLYIPQACDGKKWGEKSGSKQYYDMRNNQMKKKYQSGYTIEQISQEFGLAYDTVRKIVYKK
jgi:hypothetical protein